MTYSCREKLTLALDAALTARSASLLNQLLDSHGAFIFALALAALSSRHMAEVLSMLATAEQVDVHRRLALDDRARLAQVGVVEPNESAWAGRQPSVLQLHRSSGQLKRLNPPCISRRITGQIQTL